MRLRQSGGRALTGGSIDCESAAFDTSIEHSGPSEYYAWLL